MHFMKNIRNIVLTISLLAFLSVPAFAQTKTASVDMKKLFNGYWKTKSDQTLLEKSQRMSGNLVADIQKFVADKAKAGNYTLVLNSAATEVVVYSDTGADITDSVLKQLNEGAPIDVTKPVGGMPFNISTNLP